MKRTKEVIPNYHPKSEPEPEVISEPDLSIQYNVIFIDKHKNDYHKEKHMGSGVYSISGKNVIRIG